VGQFFSGSTTTSVETLLTPRTAAATSIDFTFAAIDFVFPDKSTTPLLTDATLIPLSSIRRFALKVLGLDRYRAICRAELSATRVPSLFVAIGTHIAAAY